MGVQFRVLSDGHYDPDQFDMVYVTNPDIHGVSRGRFVLKNSFPGVVKHGLGMTKGALVAGIKIDIPVGLTDLEEEGWGSGIQMPEMSTLRPLSWLSTEAWKVGSVICDFETTTGERNKTSTREIAKTQLQALKSMGFQPMVSAVADVTLYYKNSLKPIPLHENVSNLLAKLALAFEQSDILVESVGMGLEPGKLQIAMKEQPALDFADDMFRLHGAVRSICGKAGYDVTLMTKPLPDISSNTTQLTWRLLDSQKRNVFSDMYQPTKPSTLAQHFLAGQIKHNQAICALSKPTVNCYRAQTTDEMERMKLLGEGESWSFQDNTATSASNPYLVVAAVLAAGIDGLDKKMELTVMKSQSPEPAKSLKDALENLDKDTFMKDQLGALFVKSYLYLKTDFEIERFGKSALLSEQNTDTKMCPLHNDRELYWNYL